VRTGLCDLLGVMVNSPRLGCVSLAFTGPARPSRDTGALSWGLALLGAQHTGKVMSWVGTALYGAFAVGAPLGTALYEGYGFEAIALTAITIPLATLPLVARLRPVPPTRSAGARFAMVASAVWMPGLALALSGVGFGAITAFIALLYAKNGWGPSWVAFTSLSIAFMAGRLLFGHLPDRIGGARVAVCCILLEVIGQAFIWRATLSTWALIGTVLTGLGYSLVYPGLGVEALRRAPPQSRGIAMGSYTAFLDLSLAVSGPGLGLVANGVGLSAVFLVSASFALSAAALAMRLIARPPRLK
jgi:predicted MFS family arabinose efflux permease